MKPNFKATLQKTTKKARLVVSDYVCKRLLEKAKEGESSVYLESFSIKPYEIKLLQDQGLKLESVNKYSQDWIFVSWGDPSN